MTNEKPLEKSAGRTITFEQFKEKMDSLPEHYFLNFSHLYKEYKDKSLSKHDFYAFFIPRFIRCSIDNIGTFFREFRQSIRNKREGFGFFPDSQSYDLYGQARHFLYPRLRMYKDAVEKGYDNSIPIWVKELKTGQSENHPSTHLLNIDFEDDEEYKELREEWLRIIDDMIYAFNPDIDDIMKDFEVDRERVKRGSYYFGKFWLHMWF